MTSSQFFRATFATLLCTLALSCAETTPSGGAPPKGSDPSHDDPTRDDRDDPEPVPPPSCGAGKFAKQASGGSVVCQPCPAGTFNGAEDATSCQPWSVCTKAEPVLVEGTSKTDQVCDAPWVAPTGGGMMSITKSGEIFTLSGNKSGHVLNKLDVRGDLVASHEVTVPGLTYGTKYFLNEQGTVMIATDQGQVHVHDAEGKEIWDKKFSFAIVNAAINAQGETVFLGLLQEGAKHLLIVTKCGPDGQELWTTKPAPAFGAGDSKVHAPQSGYPGNATISFMTSGDVVFLDRYRLPSSESGSDSLYVRKLSGASGAPLQVTDGYSPDIHLDGDSIESYKLMAAPSGKAYVYWQVKSYSADNGWMYRFALVDFNAIVGGDPTVEFSVNQIPKGPVQHVGSMTTDSSGVLHAIVTAKVMNDGTLDDVFNGNVYYHDECFVARLSPSKQSYDLLDQNLCHSNIHADQRGNLYLLSNTLTKIKAAP